ncbi:MAG: LysM peptidoglycan-binding domain-containing protein [Proteiniphilum sp.]|nr:LysM peptidoglycan-binding domain-containing protein [Proteiniphilum sp.]
MNYNHKYRYIFTLLILIGTIIVPNEALGQTRLRIYNNYINTYAPIAQRNMADYKIPASITLAQGLLESGAGMSDLSKRSNNHFGIKCHNGWRGEKAYAADDSPNDCFRKYKRVEDSYEDHAQFLANNIRYRDLFKLRITDYMGWARGLQKSGYATDRAYANKLIKLIEDYELYKYDNKSYKGSNSTAKPDYSNINWTHQPYKTHDLVYVIAVNGDTYGSIANEFGFKEKHLLKYNDVEAGFPLFEGDIVYFQKKKARADEPYYSHVIQIGESMHSISQKYGIRLRELYRLNKKSYKYVPEEGDKLKLR